MPDTSYLGISPEVGHTFSNAKLKGPIFMLNLLKFKPVADYSSFPTLAPEEPVSGTAAYKRYMDSTVEPFQRTNGNIIFFGQAQPFLIGPEAESWDAMLLVQYPSKEVFLSFISDPDYLQYAGHRTAALADSRLLPMSKWPLKDFG